MNLWLLRHCQSDSRRRRHWPVSTFIQYHTSLLSIIAISECDSLISECWNSVGCDHTWCVLLIYLWFVYKMSWQDYVDKQLLASKCVTKAAIGGHDGNVWAKSEGFEVSAILDFVTDCRLCFSYKLAWNKPYLENSKESGIWS